jgi:hypothetical protein
LPRWNIFQQDGGKLESRRNLTIPIRVYNFQPATGVACCAVFLMREKT